MKAKLIAMGIACVLVVAMAPPAAAQTFDGYILRAFKEEGQPHRLYVEVSSGNRDSEDCRIKLAKKVLILGTDTDNHQSGVSSFYFRHRRYRNIAFRQAHRQMPGPTWRVQCETES